MARLLGTECNELLFQRLHPSSNDMRHETRIIGSNRRRIFSYAHPGGRVSDDPAAERRKAAIEIRQKTELLLDETFGSISVR